MVTCYKTWYLAFFNLKVKLYDASRYCTRDSVEFHYRSVEHKLMMMRVPLFEMDIVTTFGRISHTPRI